MIKNIIVVVLIFLFASMLFAQDVATESKQEFKNIKKIESKLSEEAKVEIRKPDNSSLLLRKETKKIPYSKLNLLKVLKKSNRALY